MNVTGVEEHIAEIIAWAEERYVDGGRDGNRERHSNGEEKKIDQLQKAKEMLEDIPGIYWFMSTACPLTAATLGPVANVMSICALVYPWRVYMPPQSGYLEGNGLKIEDPHWFV